MRCGSVSERVVKYPEARSADLTAGSLVRVRPGEPTSKIYCLSSKFPVLLGALCRVVSGNRCEQEIPIGCAANLLEGFRIPEFSCCASQRIELGIAVRGVGEQQQEDNVDRLIVDGIEIDGVMQPSENGKGCLQAFEPRVRKGETVAQTCRAQRFAFGDLAHDLLSIQVEFRCSFGAELAQQARFVFRPDIEHHFGRRQEIAYLHGMLCHQNV
jgi:hypothetical protein